MVRFRCPTSSTVEDTAASTAAKLARRTFQRPSKLDKAKAIAKALRPHRIREAQIRQDYKVAIEKARKRMIFEHSRPFVYVGNLNSTITKEILKETFEQFGKVRDVCIRTCGGLYVPNCKGKDHKAVPGERQYASIIFDHAISARKARSLNNATINGVQIMVTAEALALPESMDIIKQRAQAIPKSIFNWRTQLASLKRMLYRKKRTLIAEDFAETTPKPGPSHEPLARKGKMCPAVPTPMT